MGTKNRRIDIDVTEIHSQMRRSNLILRQRINDVREELEHWCQEGLNDLRNGDMPKE